MDIEAVLPHRAPFLFVDCVTELDAGQSATGFHDVRDDAFWVQGHFPGRPVMPGVLIAEALAQVAALAAMTGDGELAGQAVFLVGYDKLRFRSPVRPGDRLVLHASLERHRRGVVTFSARAEVEGRRVADGSLMAVLAPADEAAEQS